MPRTSSPSYIFTRTGVEFSIRRLRYLASSNVCSGARDPLLDGGVGSLLVELFLSLLLRRWRRLPLPVGRHRDTVLRRSKARALNLPIIAVARGYPQIGVLQLDLELVKRILGQRHILRIEAQEVLSAELPDDLAEDFVQFRSAG